MKILNFGSCNIDLVYSVDHIVVPGETISTYGMDIFPGGKGLNQSIAAARAGANVYHAGCIGNDGGMLRDIMAESGVNLEYIKEVEEKNGHAIIQVSKCGENSIFLYPGSNEMVSEGYIDSVLESFSIEDMILLQNEISNVDYIIKKAYQKGMQIVFNPAPFDEKLKEIDIGMLSYIILNEVEAKGFTGKDEPEEIIAYMKKNYPELKVVLTLGKKGCIYSDKHHALSHPAFQVEAVDTTAAGDTFIGYFLCAVAGGKMYSEAIRLACAASALTVSKMGAAPSIPHKEETYEALKELEVYSQGDRPDKTESIKKNINSYIDENIKSARLGELANMLGYSETYTGEIIKKITGETFSKVLQNKRCGIAAKLLVETEMSVGEIISKIGYENESFFRKTFKTLYGKTPYQYRKMMRISEKNK